MASRNRATGKKGSRDGRPTVGRARFQGLATWNSSRGVETSRGAAETRGRGAAVIVHPSRHQRKWRETAFAVRSSVTKAHTEDAAPWFPAGRSEVTSLEAPKAAAEKRRITKYDGREEWEIGGSAAAARGEQRGSGSGLRGQKCIFERKVCTDTYSAQRSQGSRGKGGWRGGARAWARGGGGARERGGGGRPRGGPRCLGGVVGARARARGGGRPRVRGEGGGRARGGREGARGRGEQAGHVVVGR